MTAVVTEWGFSAPMSVSTTLLSTLNASQPIYLWVVGHMAAAMPQGSAVGDRFHVLSTQIWRDDQPTHPLTRDTDLPQQALPYLRLHRHHLHIPAPYGIVTPTAASLGVSFGSSTPSPLLLLHNIPVDAQGNLLPSLEMAWSQASAVRQLYWLWQIGQLWDSLLREDVASSLLQLNNVRVEEWRIRLCELRPDATTQPRPKSAMTDSDGTPSPPASAQPPSLQDLGQLWMTLAKTAQPSIQETLTAIAQAMQAPHATWMAIAPQLNQALLNQAAQLPLRLDIAGATTPGRSRSHNEDAAFPLTHNSESSNDRTSAGLLYPRLAMVCDGIGGHVGGEVASQLVVRALKLQMSALFADIFEQDTDEPTPPHLVAQQLEAAVRVVNNLISVQNDEQGRQSRQRMGTTLIMAVQLPQRVQTPNGKANAHELYLVQIGDSRAYWLTPHRCHCLTLDDDVKTREVLAGRSLPPEAARRSDAIALTQALGTRQGEHLQISVQRFVLEEDGVLLLCSDGLSDSNLVERYWQSLIPQILRGSLSLNDGLSRWIDLANQHNGRDNISLVMMRCRVSKDSLDFFDPSAPAAPIQQRVVKLNQATPRKPQKNRPKAAPKPSQAEISAQTPSNFAPATQAETRHEQAAPNALSDESLGQFMLSTRPGQRTHPSATAAKGSSAQRSTTKPKSSLHKRPPSNRTAQPSQLRSTPNVGDAASSFDTFDALTSELTGDRSFTQPDPELNEENQDWNWMAIALGLAVVMFCVGSAGIVAWRQLAPEHFDRTWTHLIERYGELLIPSSSTSDEPQDKPPSAKPKSTQPQIEPGDPVFNTPPENFGDNQPSDN